MQEIYSEVRIKIIPEMTLAQYAVVSLSPEIDASVHMLRWAERHSLAGEKGDGPRIIGWDFPFVSAEQRDVFGMRGYVAACVLPAGFSADGEDAEIVKVAENRYAYITVRQPREDSLRRIPNSYKRIFEYIERNGLKQAWDARVSFEEEYASDGQSYMDIHVPIE